MIFRQKQKSPREFIAPLAVALISSCWCRNLVRIRIVQDGIGQRQYVAWSWAVWLQLRDASASGFMVPQLWSLPNRGGERGRTQLRPARLMETKSLVVIEETNLLKAFIQCKTLRLTRRNCFSMLRQYTQVQTITNWVALHGRWQKLPAAHTYINLNYHTYGLITYTCDLQIEIALFFCRHVYQV